VCVVPPRFWLEVNGKLHAPSSLTPVEIDSVAHCIGAFMSPRSDLDTLAKNNMFSCAGIRPIIPFFCPLCALFVISTELSQLLSWIYFERSDVRITIVNFTLALCVLGCIACRLVETCQRC
jgi:hypothetical protein